MRDVTSNDIYLIKKKQSYVSEAQKKEFEVLTFI